MAERITAIIIDDERLARLALRNKLQDFKEIEIVGEANNVDSAIKSIEDINPELIFLDIQLFNETGFDVLNKTQYNGKIIFVTAHDEYAIRAFEVNALDYILKPISHERLQKAIEKLKSNEINKVPKTEIFNYEDRILIMSGESMKFIKIDTVTHIIASGDYSSIHTKDRNEYLSSKKMNEWEERLPKKSFVRIHRSTIVNIDFIEKIEKWFNYSFQIYLKNIEIPFKVSRNNLKKIKDKFC